MTTDDERYGALLLCAANGHKRWLGGHACYCGEIKFEPVVDLMTALEESVKAAKAARRNPSK
jgi:hypothetical protein